MLMLEFPILSKSKVTIKLHFTTMHMTKLETLTHPQQQNNEWVSSKMSNIFIYLSF